MNVFMTNGTYKFLKNLAHKHPDINFYFLNNHGRTTAYYEGNKKSVFAAGREYEALLKSGKVKKTGYVVINNIPVTDEGRPIFEDRFKQRQNKIDSLPGFQAFRLLKPKSGNTYAVFTQWASEKDYKNWKNSEDFQISHNNPSVKLPAYFSNRPFVNSYSMVDEEEL